MHAIYCHMHAGHDLQGCIWAKIYSNGGGGGGENRMIRWTMQGGPREWVQEVDRCMHMPAQSTESLRLH